MRRTRTALLAVVLAGLAVAGTSGVADAGPPPTDTTPPVIRINVPREGALVPRLFPADQGFNCQDEEGGSEVASCVATEYDTVDLGPASYTVTAEDFAGNVATRTVHFRIVHARCFDQPVNVYGDLGDEPTAGDDVILAANLHEGTTVHAGRGDDVVCALRGVAQRNVVHGGPGDDRIATGGHGYGEHGNDVLVGSLNSERFYGGPGRDFLLGADGNDRLTGGPGADWLDGGPRSDQCVRPLVADHVVSCERR